MFLIYMPFYFFKIERESDESLESSDSSLSF